MSQISRPALVPLTPFLFVRHTALKSPLNAVLLAFLIFPGARTAVAQAAAEYGHAVAGAGTNVSVLKTNIDSAMSSNLKPGSTLTPETKSGSAVPTGEAADAANRRALEQRAGKDAAKLTLKSVPAKAMVRIDGKPVGLTPLPLTLAPGAYQVEMEGPRMEFGKQQIDLRPQETREVELRLLAAPRYPSHIRLQ